MTKLRIILGFTIFVSGYGLIQFLKPVFTNYVLIESRSWVGLALVWSVVLILMIGILITSWSRLNNKLLAMLLKVFRYLHKLGAYNNLFLALLIATFCFLVLGPYGQYLRNIYIRIGLFSLFVLLGAICLKAAGNQHNEFILLGASAVFITTGYRLAAFLPDISNYPFSLGWSEASRYYYASLYLSEKVYGVRITPTVLHPSRYLMQAVPFIFDGTPIWVHRAWQVLLWITTTFLTAFFMTKRLSIEDKLKRWTLIMLGGMILLILPVYYHLQIPLIIILATFNKHHYWRNVLFIIIASVWTGISRVNWYPIPAMLAVTLYTLEIPVRRYKSLRYLIWPAIFGIVGLSTALFTQWLYIISSGNPPGQFASSFSSDLLWYRLFPNPTYQLGVLSGCILVSIPFWLLSILCLWHRWRSYHKIQLLIISIILLTFCIGGIIVSIKIGGGSNLHNLDAYFSILIVISAYIYYDKFQLDSQANAASKECRNHSARSFSFGKDTIIATLICFSIFFTLQYGKPLELPSPSDTQISLDRLSRFVEKAVTNDGDVLFISERQLVTFRIIPDVAIIPDYEKVFLMEMAMAGNEPYLARLANDLKEHKYSLIVSDPLFINYKGSAEPFGEENDAWVKYVSEPILCYYEPYKILRDIHLQVLTPRTKVTNCD